MKKKAGTIAIGILAVVGAFYALLLVTAWI